MSAQHSAGDREYGKRRGEFSPSERSRHGLGAVPDRFRSRESRWAPADLRPYLDGTYRRPRATIGRLRSDRQAMLYEGKDHLIYGPTGSGKTMLALALCADVICDPDGSTALYVHFEEPDALDVVDRLRHVYTVPDEPIMERFRFVSPVAAARGWEIDDLAEDEHRLVVLDGVNEAMTLFGRGEGFGSDNWSRFRQAVIMPFLRAGSAVVCLDHVTKADSDAPLPMNSVQKINAATGVAYYLRPHEDADADHRGCSWVLISKDRPGSVKRSGIRREGRRGMAPFTYWGAMITDVRAPNSNPLWIAPPRQSHLDVMDGGSDEDF
jgi:AAA domain